MVRGSGVDDPARSDLYGDVPDVDGGQPGRPGRRPRRTWTGGGGRWYVWALRAVLWAVLLIIGYRGIMAIVLDETPASRSGSSSGTSPAGSATSSFPATLAEAYAMQFGSVYLNYSPATASQRRFDRVRSRTRPLAPAPCAKPRAMSLRANVTSFSDG